MTDEEVMEVLQTLLQKGTLTPSEVEAVRASIGVFALTNKVADSHIAAMKKKKARERSIE